MATADGLARFDGVRFTTFNTANTEGLATNSLGFMTETNDGSLWITTENRGLVRLQNGIFTSYTTAQGLPSNTIWSLNFLKSENLLRVRTDKGFVCFNEDRFFPCKLPLISQENNLNTLIDNTGAIWIRNGEELRALDGQDSSVFQIPKFFSKSKFNLLFRDSAGNYWLAADDVINGDTIKFSNGKTEVFSSKDGLPSGIINAIFEDKRGNIWFGSKTSGGLAIYNNGKFQLFTKKNGLSSEGFSQFFEDREGGIWSATADGGIMRFTTQFISSISVKDGLSGQGIYPLFEDIKGVIWIGDWGNTKGLTKIENGKLETVSGGRLFTSFFEDREGFLWVGSYNQIGKIENGQFKTQFTILEKAVSAIIQNRDGVFLFGTNDGLKRMHNPPNFVKKPPDLLQNDGEYFDNFTTENGLPSNDIKVLHFDRKGTLWIGTTGGLAKFENEQITAFTEKDGISGNHIRSIYEDAEGVLWFGTFDNGLTRLKDGKFSSVRLQNGLFDQGVFQILEDNFGRFWISSNRGIYRVNKQELNDFADGKIQRVTSIGYGEKDGMPDAECNGGVSPAGFKSKRDGTLWFPTQKGIAVVNPNALPLNRQPLNIVIENCLIDGKETDCNNLQILPENESLEIKYTTLSFDKPEQIRFKHKLEGLDENWVDAGTRRRAYFTHLPPGNYSFIVSAANIDGIWNETGANLKFSVKPPFYRTFWFLILCALAVSAIILFLFNLRIKNLKKLHTAQEEFSRKLIASQESERQRIATELHDGLGQNLLIIKNWAMIALKNDKDSSAQLMEISETASAAIDEVREIAYNLRPFHLDELGLTKAVQSMIEPVSRSSNNEFDSELDSIDGYFPRELEISFYRIVQECINNIVKHSQATKAVLKIKRNKNGNLHFSIRDNGKGFKQENVALGKHRQKGFGLTGINERARILGGKLTVNSSPGEGTTIRLTFL